MFEKKHDSENDATDATKKEKHQFRMRHDWNNLIDDLIQDGQNQGLFDDLPGKGKPLNLKKNIYGVENELAHGLMKNNDIVPAWIMNRNQILEQIDALRANIQRTWQRHEREFRIIQDEIHRDSLTISWDDACQKWLSDIETLNKKINDFNLKRPINNLELLKLNFEIELKRVGALRRLL